MLIGGDPIAPHKRVDGAPWLHIQKCRLVMNDWSQTSFNVGGCPVNSNTNSS
jgi:hypothetical protein